MPFLPQILSESIGVQRKNPFMSAFSDRARLSRTPPARHPSHVLFSLSPEKEEVTLFGHFRFVTFPIGGSSTVHLWDGSGLILGDS
jgi:hypothetical protein